MAQKRNPISLRLQTRLQGHEKRFASPWFTDSFFSQVYPDDLAKRLYLGHLLQKGGSWYGEVSESRIPETCISIQFLYRKCSILSVILDRRKEEYLSLNRVKGAKPKSELSSRLSRQEHVPPRIARGAEMSTIHLDLKKRGAYTSRDGILSGEVMLFERDKLLGVSGNMKAVTQQSRTSLSGEYVDKSVPTDKTVYLSIANCLEDVAHKDKRCASSIVESQRHWRDWLFNDWRTDQRDNIIPDSLYSPEIESICNAYSGNGKDRDSPFPLLDLERERYAQADMLTLASKEFGFANLEADQTESQERLLTPLIPGSYWTNCRFVKGVSASQNVEFCLYSVAFLYKKRFSFLRIKDMLFRKLSTNESVQGVRLVCSGRQGGRSKSAMRARKQSAAWGRTALSLFSSRLAYASTGVDTSFGQIGVKIWVCYK